MMLDPEITKNWKLITEDDSVPKKEIQIVDGLIFGREESCDIYIISNHISRQHAQLEVFESLIRIKDLDSSNGIFVNGKQVREAELKDGDELCIDKVKFSVLLPMSVEEPLDNDKTVLRPVVNIDKTMMRPAVVVDEAPQLVEENTHVTQILPTLSDADRTTKEEVVSQESIDLNFDSLQIESSISEEKIAEEELDLFESEMSSEEATNDSAELENASENNIPDDSSLLSTFELDAPVASLIGKSKPFIRQIFDITSSPTSIGRVFSNDIVLDESSVSSRHAELRFEKGDWYIIDQDSYNGTYVNNNECKNKKLIHGDVIGFGRVQLEFHTLEKSKNNKLFNYKNKWFIAALLAVFIIAVLSYVFFNDEKTKITTTPVWTHTVDEKYQDLSAPIIKDMNKDGVNDVIIALQSGQIKILNGANGMPLSAFEVGQKIVLAPLVLDVNYDGLNDVIVATQSGQLQAYTQKGIAIWKHILDDKIEAINQQISYFDLNNDDIKDIIISARNMGVVAVDGSNGETLWQSDDLISGHVVSSPLLGDFNRDGEIDIIVITDENKLIAMSTQVGESNLLWQQNIAEAQASPVALKTSFSNLIILATKNQGVLAFNGENGKPVWQTKLSENIFTTPVILQSNNSASSFVFISISSGKLIAINANNGEIIWQSNIGAKLETSPVLFSLDSFDESLLLIADMQGRYSIVNTYNGDILLTQKQDTANSFKVTPAVDDLNNHKKLKLILASQNGRIFAQNIQASSL